MTIYTNPRMHATIEGWPSGGRRVVAGFDIEVHKTKGQRAVRVTTGKPVKLTYGVQQRIVNGNDGRTYIAILTMYGHITIMRGDMKYNEETFFENDPRYAEVRALFTP